MIYYHLHKSIAIVGLMGAGKSSIGKRLSEEIIVPFVDSDDEIELAAGMSVSEIFEKFGEAYFRAGEERVMKRLLSDRPQIIATGGGAFMSNKIRSAIKLNAVSVWLNADFETLWTRVQGKQTRPLLKVKNPKLALQELIKQRTSVYANADIIVTSKKYGTHSSMVTKLIKVLITNRNLEKMDEKKL